MSIVVFLVLCFAFAVILTAIRYWQYQSALRRKGMDYHMFRVGRKEAKTACVNHIKPPIILDTKGCILCATQKSIRIGLTTGTHCQQ